MNLVFLLYAMNSVSVSAFDRFNLSLGLNPTTTQFWLVVFGLNGPLRQYFSLYRAVSQREGERKEK